jgi:hypothetical protein
LFLNHHCDVFAGYDYIVFNQVTPLVKKRGVKGERSKMKGFFEVIPNKKGESFNLSPLTLNLLPCGSNYFISNVACIWKLSFIFLKSMSDSAGPAASAAADLNIIIARG